MQIERSQVYKVYETISPEEYGEEIAKKIISWYLDDTTVDETIWEHYEERELVAIGIIRTLVDSMGLSNKVKIEK